MKNKLRKLRTDKGISQKQIASILPTDVSNYNRKELGDVKITKQEWEKISVFLEVSVEEIFEADEEKKTPSKHKSPILNDTFLGIKYLEIIPSIIENLQDFINILKKNNEELKMENQKLKDENTILKSRMN
ncbi:helix-turn-helix transcriptional regulator [Chryseobacterium sp. JK1]|uniref:helix-turn-helix transcriptional regulator n=1 Tax=Chryseobacterium sp. JK1 TaxID=874294 RepID=UPI003D69A8C5